MVLMHEPFIRHSDECERWKQCCEAALECCDTQLGTAHVTGDGRHCLRTWDGFGCWQDTAPNSHVYNPCPSFIQHAMPSSKIWYTYCCNVINSVKIYLYSSLLTVSLKKHTCSSILATHQFSFNWVYFCTMLSAFYRVWDGE